jgi:hypothetical protein
MSEDVLTAADLRKLWHMLGAGPDNLKRNWGYRNHYASGNGGDAYESMCRMERLGLVVAAQRDGSMTFFHATEAGCREAGLDAKQIKRALED